ncbi:MAG: precorrin-8X methylmutase, partial [Acidimicrobiales bacterium]
LPDVAVWPFDTGLTAAVEAFPPVTLAEIWPGLLTRLPVAPGMVRDETQVRAAVAACALRQGAGLWPPALAPAPAVAAGAQVLDAEGWILGVL